jgi:hypothetical protein
LKFKKKRLGWALALLAALWLNLGPRPADNSHYTTSGYYQDARRRLELAKPLSASGPLKIGLAEIDISPPPGYPLAGFGGRRPKANTGQDSPCLARALTLEVNGLTTSILTADILLMDESLVSEVLHLSGLGPQDVYFTASHSHSCAGGYVKGLLMEQILGDYDPAWTKQLAQRLAQLLLDSRRDLIAADLAWTSLEVPNSQQNRIDHAAPTNDRLSLLLFRKHDSLAACQTWIVESENRPQRAQFLPDLQPNSPAIRQKSGEKCAAAVDLQPTTSKSDRLLDPPLAIFAVFGAHATLFNLKSHLISADYPGYFLHELKARTQAKHLLFAAGSVGDARPDGPAIIDKDAKVNAQTYGHYLAEAAAAALENLNWSHEVSLGRLNLALQLPEARLLLGPKWTLGPLLTQLLPDRQASLSGLRLNNLVLLGFPADYSGHLARALSAQINNQAHLITTSFNGGYKGYLVASRWFFSFSDYETRTVNFFGPWSGDYLNEMAAGLIKRMFH